MESTILLRTPSVGKVVKEILAINPTLGTQEIIAIVRSSVRVQGGGDFGRVETVDEKFALELARKTLNS